MAGDRRTTRRDFVIAGSAGIAGASLLGGCTGPGRRGRGAAPRVVRRENPGANRAAASRGEHGLVLRRQPGSERARRGCRLHPHLERLLGAQARVHDGRGVQRQTPGLIRRCYQPGPALSPPAGPLTVPRRRYEGPSGIDCGIHRRQPRTPRPRPRRHLLPVLGGQPPCDPLRALHAGVRAAQEAGQDPVRRHRHPRQRARGDPRGCGKRFLGHRPDRLQLPPIAPREGPRRHRHGRLGRPRGGRHEDPGRRLLGQGAHTFINQKAALKWVLLDENVHTAIPAFSNFDELHEGLSVMEDLEFTPTEARDLEDVERSVHAGLFCQQCGHCMPQCPLEVEIPTLMRAYMYAVGHAQSDKARSTLQGFSLGEIECIDCPRCTVQCALGLNIQSRAREMVQLLT